MKEQDYTYDLYTELSCLNEQHVLKPYIYQNLFSQVVGRHLKNIGSDFETLGRNDLAWVLVSLSIEVKKPITGAMHLIAQTWYSQHRGPFYRREICVKNEQGEVVFCGSTFSVLFNLETRSVSRQSALPFWLPAPNEEYTIEADPIFRSNLPYEKMEERVMRPSFIDGLGHVNNARYAEFAYDVLTGEELLDMPAMKRMDVYFISELRLHDTLAVLKAKEGNKIYVRGMSEAKKCTAFETVLWF